MRLLYKSLSENLVRHDETARLRILPDVLTYVKYFYKTFCTFFVRIFGTVIDALVFHIILSIYVFPTDFKEIDVLLSNRKAPCLTSHTLI